MTRPAAGAAALIAALAVAGGAAVLADVALMPQVNSGLFYLLPVLLAPWLRRPLEILALTAGAALLAIAGHLFVPGALSERVLAILAIAAVGAALALVKRRECQQRAERDGLAARLREREAALTATRTQATLASRTASNFLSGMSHELRTPLNAIIGFSEIIKSEIFGPVGSARYRTYMKDINESGQHLLGLINDLLDMAHLEAGDERIEEDSVAVPALIHACVAEIMPRARANSVTVVTEMSDDLPPLRADPAKLRQVLENLLSNAVKFTPGGGRIRVAAWARPEAGYVIQVADNGIGIALKDIAIALAPFGQIDNPLRRPFEGTGLGLPLAKALVEMHAGSIDLQSEPNAGTTVTLRFPAERIELLSRVA